MSGKEAIFWDSCVFIAYAKNENRSDSSDIAGIEYLVQSIDMNQYVLVTSVVTIPEVLEKSTGSKAYNIFLDILKKPNLLLVDITRYIAEIAHEIRNEYCFENGQRLTTPDSLQIAAALNYKCSAFYTFDGCSTKGNGLLQLHDQIKNSYGLEILKPQPKYPYQEKLIN
ncbi:MAG: PIN domain-containing protein [Anaerolineaceae bacterium]